MQTLESGDLIERTFASDIRTHLSSYERFWGNFIGNNGNNHMIDITGESPNQHDVRLQISQLSYSLMHNALSMLRLVEKIQHASSRLDKGTSVLEYFERRDIFNIISLECGKVKDHVERIFQSVEGEQMADSIDHIYQQLGPLYAVRHIGVHGKELPYFIEKDQVYLPFFDQVSGWKNEKTWEEATMGVAFSEWAIKTVYEVIPLINQVFCKLYDFYATLYKGRHINIPGHQSPINAVASGTVTNHTSSDASATSAASGSSGMVGTSGFEKSKFGE